MSVSSDLDSATMHQHIVETARELVGARYGALGLVDSTGTFITEWLTAGLDAEERAGLGAVPKGHGVLGTLIANPQPLRLPDLGEHPDSFGFPPGHPPMKSFLGVPLYVRGEVYGNLYLTDKDDEDGFSDIDEELAIGFAAAASLMIDNAHMQQYAAELSVLADRERIGRDLHDTAIQCLFATGLAMTGTARRLDDRPEVAARLEEHVNDIDNAIRQIRSAVFEMGTRRAPGSSLRRDVLDMIAQSARVLGFAPTMHFYGPVDTAVSAASASHLLPVLREALSNVARHAKATRVAVTVRAEGELCLEVLDNGRHGTASFSSGGSGVRNMDHRAQDLGGHAEIGPGPTSGTRVYWVVPL